MQYKKLSVMTILVPNEMSREKGKGKRTKTAAALRSVRELENYERQSTTVVARSSVQRSL